MNYVVLDMEWNQPGFGDVTLCKNGVCMKNEIIQIGAVKLDDRGKRVDSFECIIKPVTLTSMNKIIMQLTGITNEMLDKGDDFKSAMTSFKDWCGQDFVFLIWGYDDIRILRNNLAFHNFDSTWLPKSYNLQMIFSNQTQSEKRQYSLTYALEHFNIQIDEQLHDALNDAEYTAMICERLDLKEGIKNINLLPSSESKNAKNANVLIKRKFRYIRRREDIWANGFIVRPVCPFCGEKMTFDKPKRKGNTRINIEGHCQKDGDFAIILRVNETPEGTFTVNQQIYKLDEKMRKYLESKKNTRPNIHRTAKNTHKNTVTMSRKLSEKEQSQ